MERLTEDSVTGETYIKQCASSCPYDGDFCGTDECPVLNAVADKLGEYERAEEQGLLVRLPANNKDIYIISSRWTVCSEYGSRFDEYSCSGCEYECDSKKEYYVYPTYLSFINVNTYVNQIGKTVFLTREEAEKKLEEMKNEWLQRKSCRTFK